MLRRAARLGLLVPAGVALAVSAALTSGLLSTWTPAAAAVAAGCAAIGLLVRRLLRRGSGAAGLLPTAIAIAIAVVAASVALHLPERMPASLPPGRSVSAVVRVDSALQTLASGHGGRLTQRSVLQAVVVSAAGRAYDAPVTVFSPRLPDADETPGVLLRLRLTVLQRDASGLTAAGADATRVGSPAPVLALAAALRHGLAVTGRDLPGDGGSLLPGLAIGDTSVLSPSLGQAMRSASLSHLTAVSGANCAVVVGLVLALAAVVGLPRLARVLAAGTALAAFVVLVTPQPSVLRAAVMAVVALAATATGRPATGPPLLGAAVLGLLAADPWLAAQAGFVLSALATAGLLLLTGPIADRLRMLPRRLAVAVAVPLAAQVACQPVLVLLQPVLPPAGVLANLLAEPAAPVATVLGLVACLVLPLAHPVGVLIAGVAWLPSAWIALVARVAAAVPAVPWPSGAAGAGLAAGAVVLGVLAVARSVRTPLRRLAVLVLGLAVLVLAGAEAGSSVAQRLTMPSDWEVAACDVGQGDGLVLNGGGGHFVVVDTGPAPGPLTACLGRLGVGRIDLLVLTHWDADHVGGARAIASRVATAFVGPTDGAAADELRHDLAAAGARVEQVHRGERTRVGRLAIELLWPPDPLDGVQPGNTACITMVVRGRLTSLFTGDLDEASEDAILAAGGLPQVDVVKVAHHGSADNSPQFYARADAGVALISVGAGNDYHHPTARLLGELRAAGSRPFRTDQDGMVIVSPGAGGAAEVWTERAPTGAVWTPAR